MHALEIVTAGGNGTHDGDAPHAAPRSKPIEISDETAKSIQLVLDQIRDKHPELATGFKFAMDTCFKQATAEPAGAAAAAAPAAQLPEEAGVGKREQVRAPADTPVEADGAGLGVAQRGRALAPGHEQDSGDEPRTQTRSPRGAPKLGKNGADDR